MDIRKGFLWVVHMRPCTDLSGESDVIVCTPSKSHCQSRSKECLGLMHDIVWQGWMKKEDRMLRRVVRYKS